MRDRAWLRALAENPYTVWIERHVGVTASGLIVLAMALVGWLLAHALGGRALYLLVYSGLAILGGAFILSRRRPAVGARRSELPSRAREGQVISVEITISARRRVTMLMLEEKLHPHLGSTVHVPISVLASGKDLAHRYPIRPKLRGVYNVGPLSVAWNDPFGLTRGEMTLVDEMEIMVHPATELIYDRPLTRQWEDPPIRPPRTKPWPSGFEFYGMRDYVRGDDPRRIVWRAVARTGKLMVRSQSRG